MVKEVQCGHFNKYKLLLTMILIPCPLCQNLLPQVNQCAYCTTLYQLQKNPLRLASDSNSKNFRPNELFQKTSPFVINSKFLLHLLDLEDLRNHTNCSTHSEQKVHLEKQCLSDLMHLQMCMQLDYRSKKKRVKNKSLLAFSWFYSLFNLRQIFTAFKGKR